MKDYFRLLGEECDEDLRHRIDVSLHICDSPSEERYAQICPRYDGRCAIMLPDGRCAIHAELGEDALPALCRLYPRGVRPNFECSCANSCEAVIEMLINRDKPLSFKKINFEFENVANVEMNDDETVRFEKRMALIRMMQNRKKKIPTRLLEIGRELGVGQDAVETALRMGEHQLAEMIVAELDERSNALREYGEKALEWFKYGQYDVAASRFESHFPDWEIRFENILVNQMFFSQFPFGMSENRVISDGGNAVAQNMLGTSATMHDLRLNSNSVYCEFVGLCVTYIVMRFLCLGNLAEESSDVHFVDVCAALFRLVSHTDFGRTATAILTGI